MMTAPWDYAAFLSGTLGVLLVLHGWLRRSRRQPRIPRLLWSTIGGILLGGYFATNIAGDLARTRVQEMLEGFAPTYGLETERLGHAEISLETAPDDPTYLALIAAQIRWARVNPAIADIYTMRELPDGRRVFLVDSETDYDRNGRYDDDRELRTDIGEEWEDEEEEMTRALAGEAIFAGIPATDRWGTWVSAYVPLRDATGRVEGILGVDYDGEAFVRAITNARLTVIGALSLLGVLLIAYSTVVTLLRANLAERQHAEAQVRALNLDLERRVQERTAQLEATHRDLVEASRRVGMAEVATDVLHNVGNVLNSVNVSSRLIADRLRDSKLGSFAKLATLLREHEGDLSTFLAVDPQGRRIPPYLLTLADHLKDEQVFLNQELSALSKHIEHIKAVLHAQQRLARVSDMLEAVDLREVLEDALQIHLASLTRHEVEIVREYGPAPLAWIEKHKALQILVNLIGNAKDAVMSSGKDRRVIVLGLAAPCDGRVTITVRDNGAGIAPENLARIFSHGFTTKPTGHGFGLHSAAIAAKELEGDLHAESPGLGQGATFVLELPTATAQAARAAGEQRATGT